MIRPALLSEANAIRALARDAFTRWVERFGREPSPMQEDYPRRIADGQVWVLEAEGRLVGLVVLKDGPGDLLVQNVAVAPAAQGKGHGRRLIGFAEAEAKRRGYDQVRLYVNTFMLENVALYRHLGFVEVGRVDGKTADRSYVAMAKPVA